MVWNDNDTNLVPLVYCSTSPLQVDRVVVDCTRSLSNTGHSFGLLMVSSLLIRTVGTSMLISCMSKLLWGSAFPIPT